MGQTLVNDSATLVRRQSCPVCDSRHATTLVSRPYTDPALLTFMRDYYYAAKDIDVWLGSFPYEVDRCVDCSLAFQRYVPSPRFASVLYDEWLNATHHPSTAPYRELLDAPEKSRDGHELMAAAAALKTPIHRLRVLDYGMGWGLWIRIAHSLGAEAFGYDLSTVRCDFARSEGIFIVQPGEFTNLSADFINADQVLEHLTDPYDAVAEMALALKPGGLLKIAVPQVFNLKRRLAVLDWSASRRSRHSLLAVHPLEHINCFNRRSLEHLCSRAGLQPAPVPLSAYGAFLQVPGAIPSTNPRQLLKALARPFYNWLSPSNLYAWFRKPLVAGPTP